MYRLLSQHGEVRERRRQLRHPVYQNRNCWPNSPTRSGRGTQPN
jgi:putative transposase